jgi:phage anti-repressor protein
MNDLIPISSAAMGGQQVATVDARHLHERLGVQAKFADWISRRIEEHGLAENVDFACLKNETNEITNVFPPPRIDYLLTIRTAMKIAMSEATEYGH